MDRISRYLRYAGLPPLATASATASNVALAADSSGSAWAQPGGLMLLILGLLLLGGVFVQRARRNHKSREHS